MELMGPSLEEQTEQSVIPKLQSQIRMWQDVFNLCRRKLSLKDWRDIWDVKLWPCPLRTVHSNARGPDALAETCS